MERSALGINLTALSLCWFLTDPWGSSLSRLHHHTVIILVVPWRNKQWQITLYLSFVAVLLYLVTKFAIHACTPWLIITTAFHDIIDTHIYVHITEFLYVFLYLVAPREGGLHHPQGWGSSPCQGWRREARTRREGARADREGERCPGEAGCR